MCFGGGSSSSYTPSPTPSVVPGTTNVSSGTTSSSEQIRNRYLEQLKKKRGFASTIKNEGGASGISGNVTGKTLLGE